MRDRLWTTDNGREAPSLIRTIPSAPESHRFLRLSSLAGFTADRELASRPHPAPKVCWQEYRVRKAQKSNDHEHDVLAKYDCSTALN